jgi:hypothetical protein
MPYNDAAAPLTRFCLSLEKERRKERGPIRSGAEFRRHYFPYDAARADDRVLKLLPRDVRGPVLVEWGIRGKKTALRDDDDRVVGAVHDAFLAGDIDDTAFEEGIVPEMLVAWVDLSDFFRFWRACQPSKGALGLALESAYELGLFDARWFFGAIESDGRRGTDVMADPLSESELGAWIKEIHRTGDGSPRGLLGALGWQKLVACTPAPVLLAVIDALAGKTGLATGHAEIDPAAAIFAALENWVVPDSSELVAADGDGEPSGEALDEAAVPRNSWVRLTEAGRVADEASMAPQKAAGITEKERPGT